MARFSQRDAGDQRERSLVSVPSPSSSSSSRDRALQPIRPDVTVLRNSGETLPVEAGSTRGMIAATLARAAIDMAPDVLRALEGARARRATSASGNAIVPAQAQSVQRTTPSSLVTSAPPSDGPIYTRSTRVTEREFNLRAPLVSRVVVREATSWESIIPQGSFQPNTPAASNQNDAEGGRWKMAGLMSIGGAIAVAALGVLANRTRN